MAFNIRAAIIAGIAVLVTASYCAWQFSRISQQHLNDQKVQNVTQQLAFSRTQVEQYVEKTANELTASIEKELQTPNSPIASDFIATGVLSATGNSPWAVEWFHSKNSQINQAFFETQLRNLPLERGRGDTIQFARIEAPDKRIYFVANVQIRFKTPGGEEIKIATGLLPSTYFNSAIAAAKVAGDEIFLADNTGYAYSYPDQQYVGSKMDIHPVVKQAIRSEVPSDVRPAKNLTGESVAGGFEKLGNANLMMVMTSPIMGRSAAVAKSVLQVALVSCALVLLAAGLIAFVGRKEKVYRELIEGRLRLFEQRSQAPIELTAHASDLAKKETLRDFSFGVVQYLRGPLSAILGQSQLAISKSNQPEVKEWLDRIEKEARFSRDFVESLAKSQGLGEVQIQPTELESVVSLALQDVRGAFAKNEIHIEENYKTRGKVDIAAGEFRQVLKDLFLFLNHRLSTSNAYRKVTVDVEQAGPFVRLVVGDSASSLEPDALKKIFEPFQVDGLKFSLLKNLTEKFRGTVAASTGLQGGLEIRFDFPQAELGGAKVDKPVAAASPTTPAASPIVDLKTAKPVAMPSTPAFAVSKTMPASPKMEIAKPQALNGMKPLSAAVGKDLPPVPKVVQDAMLKTEIRANELNSMEVKIRKPKTSGQDDEADS